MGICTICKQQESLKNSDLCEMCDRLQDIWESQLEEEQKSLAEEAYGTRQFSQEEIENIFIECLDSIAKQIDARLEAEFGPNRFNLKINDIDSNFWGSLVSISIRNNKIDISIRRDVISDDPGNASSIDLILLINGTEIYSESIEHINGAYGSDEFIKDEFLFTETHIERFAERVIYLINAII